jgi:hypothetical protein
VTCIQTIINYNNHDVDTILVATLIYTIDHGVDEHTVLVAMLLNTAICGAVLDPGVGFLSHDVGTMLKCICDIGTMLTFLYFDVGIKSAMLKRCSFSLAMLARR